MDKKILLLGGTADARNMTQRLHEHGLNITYSIAGKVRTPNVPCSIVVGGFGQFGGLAHYIQQNNVAAVVDVTHPYASRMSQTAFETCQQLKLHYWRFDRPAWQAESQDRWYMMANWKMLPQALQGYHSVLLTAGQMDEVTVRQIAITVPKVCLRTAVKPNFEMPKNVQWLKAIGPFSFEGERQLFNRLDIQCLVSKNSGGEATSAKLAVARQQKVPVYMLQRPSVNIDSQYCFEQLAPCIESIVRTMKR